MVSIDAPDGQSTVKVSVIDTGARISGPMNFFVEPPLLEQENGDLSAPAFVFLVEHEKSDRRILFDLGIRKKHEEYAPAVRAYHAAFEVEAGEEVFDILPRHGVDLNAIEAIVWSHHHMDHTGNPAGFPASTTLIVGPGFKETMLPGYPTDPSSHILEADYAGRDLRQLDFGEESHNLTIGGFRAIDFFDDGSFYLLESPGHTIDHLAGLARTNTSPSRFIFMGGDLGHHASQWRPTELLELPQELRPSPLGAESRLNFSRNMCLGELFTEHVHPEHSRRSPFLRIKAGHPYNVHKARDSLKLIERFDADENVFIITAHDWTLLSSLNFWPQDVNGWYDAGWKQSTRWTFLQDFAKLISKKTLQE